MAIDKQIIKELKEQAAKAKDPKIKKAIEDKIKAIQKPVTK